MGDEWRKSSYSESGNCVEFCPTPALVMVRDSKQTGRPLLIFTLAEWAAFTASIKEAP
jgi:predicted molibdopterin-dependent oxidoreductase YjgC